MSDSSQQLRVEVFSDYTCPWCYIGWARLKKALAQLPSDVEVRVDWRPFEIHPHVPAEGMPVEDLPYPPDVWARMQEALHVAAEAEDIDVSRRPKVANTRRALAAGAYAQAEEPERFTDFHERLFHGYFSEGLDLGDANVVDRLAEESGLDVDRMRSGVDSGDYDQALLDTTRDARLMGISGAPTFVFDRRFAAAGAQPTEVLLSAFDAALNQS